jgi:hypothetical protein
MSASGIIRAEAQLDAQPGSFPVSSGSIAGVAHVTANDVWAVGCKTVAERCGSWAVHWNGGDWQEYTVPHSANGSLNAIAAVSSTDVYGVGAWLTGSVHALVAHWDGRQWTQIGPSTADDFLTDVSAVSADDVWAVGGNGREPITYHWDGSTWEESVLPAPGVDAYLSGVEAIASDDVWTVGRSIVDGSFQGFIGHWNGVRWTTLELPVQWSSTSLESIDAFAAEDIWAVGSGYQTAHPTRGLALHYDGTSWVNVRLPKVKGSPKQLSSVSVGSPDSAWAVGTNGGSRQPYSIVEHWNGKLWSVVDSPDPLVELGGALTLSKRTVWAWGAIAANGHTNGYLGQWDGNSWSTP